VLVELLERLRRGGVTAAEVVAERLELLHAVHARTNAVAAFEDDRALADAAALDRVFVAAGPVGPLHGLPVTVKDWIDASARTVTAGPRSARWPPASTGWSWRSP
jgi:amidase